MLFQSSTLYAYLRLARKHQFPVGSDLFFLPAAWGLAAAAKNTSMSPQSLLLYMAVFFVGATVVHSCACIVNDICDVEYDRKVERTRTRPLASGVISVKSAWLYLVPWLVSALWLFRRSNDLTWRCGLIGLIPLNGLYPLMKRWTYWPQAWLGLAVNWGFVMGWAAVTDAINYAAIAPFVLAGVCWTIVYDTIYACQDAKDDIHAGVKSTALLFGKYIRPILMVFSAATVLLFITAGFTTNSGPAYFLVTIPAISVYIIRMMSTFNEEDLDDCSSKFKSSSTVGHIVLTGILMDYVVSVM